MLKVKTPLKLDGGNMHRGQKVIPRGNNPVADSREKGRGIAA